MSRLEVQRVNKYFVVMLRPRHTLLIDEKPAAVFDFVKNRLRRIVSTHEVIEVGKHGNDG